MQIDMTAAIDKNNETALYDARIAHILQLFRLSHPNIPLHRLPAHGLKRPPNIQDSPSRCFTYLFKLSLFTSS